MNHLRPSALAAVSILAVISTTLIRDTQIYSPPPALAIAQQVPAQSGVQVSTSVRITASPSVVSDRGGRVLLTISSPRQTPCLLTPVFPTPSVEGAPSRFQCDLGVTTIALMIPPSPPTVSEYIFELASRPSTQNSFATIPVVTASDSFSQAPLTQYEKLSNSRHIAPPESSDNWTGYEMSSTPGFKIGAVTGQWVVPTVMCNAGQSSYASQWIGIDGAGSSTVEQIGTATNCIGGRATYSSWYAMYGNTTMGGNNVRPLGLDSYPVAPGDVMTASVVAPLPMSSTSWELLLTDSTKSWTSATVLPSWNW